jgi:DNA repair protein RecO (recombination protein O)
MIQNALGIILRTRPLTETSLIVHWLTRGFGRLATVAKGARRPKSPLRGKLDLFYLADFSFRRGDRSELHTLREVVVRTPRGDLRRNLTLLQQAAYCAALVEQTTETETPIPAVFDLLCGLLDHLPLRSPRAGTVFGFEMKLLTELGLCPDLAKARVSAGSRRILEELSASGWEGSSRLRLSGDQATELERFLGGFLTFHLGKVPQSRGAAVHSD